MVPSLDSVRRLFQRMEDDGLDPAGALKYGYFFFHSRPEPLRGAAAWLAERAYVVEDLGERDDGTWVMYLAKVEQHTSESLHNRNQAMNRLAEEFGIDLYDGWDVGPVPSR